MISKKFDGSYYALFGMLQVIFLVTLLGLSTPAEVKADESLSTFNGVCLLIPEGDKCIHLSGYFFLNTGFDNDIRTLIITIPDIPEKEGGIVKSNMGKSLSKIVM